MDIFCADIGSVKKGNFGWYGRQGDGSEVYGQDILNLAEAIASRLNENAQVALGFEAPMFVPLRTDPKTLTEKRAGETDKNWIGGPGSSVLATALVQVPWILTEVRKALTVEASATTKWAAFQARTANLFIWEAFVSGKAKGDSHVDDARIAVELFEKSLPDPTIGNVIFETNVLSILGAALLRTGWATNLDVLEQSPIVLRPIVRKAVKSRNKRRTKRSSSDSPTQRKCPECEHEFKGVGWGGVDAHWKAAHSKIMSYDEAWPIIKCGRRPSDFG